MKKFIFMTLAVIAFLFTACKGNVNEPVKEDPNDSTKTDTTAVVARYDYEPEADTTIIYDPDGIIGYYNDSTRTFSIDIVNGYGYILNIIANYNSDSTRYFGDFTVDSVAAPNTVMHSNGWVFDSENDSVGAPTPTCAYKYMTGTASNSIIDTAAGVYYVVSGSMTITDSTMTADFKSKNGSTLKVEYPKEILWVDANKFENIRRR
ncbi:MAG: hypothetical protein [Wendovervirus sonii]|uniref:Lipoprotein n=1 Tax=phage Lak_Megaphage_Sonny TaxID=3109229 RepID=A0ABZ0Z3J4_9CAUD|nr:MAG: hypothetical protein [phage Lak_Megaphage_Sonny]